MLNDFKENDEIGYDQYGAVHFAFSSQVSKDLMQLMGNNKKLAERVYSMLEVNCDFSIFEDNVFLAPKTSSFPLSKTNQTAI